MRTIVFINSHSRQAAQNIEAVRKFFSMHSDSFKVLDFIVVEDLENFGVYLKKLRGHKNVECIIVGSGDGTIVAVLNTMKAKKNIVYGFLPLGTSNTFVKSLGLPLDFRKALKVFSHKHVRSASLGSINGTLFANIADIGVPAQVANNVTDKVKKYLGSFAYAISGIRELLHHEPVWCEVKIDGETKKFLTHHLFIANGKYRGPVSVSKDTSAFSGTLTLGYSATPNRWQYLQDAFGFLLGTAERHRNLHFTPIKKATIKTTPVQVIQADGEVIGNTPAEVRVIKDAIRVLTTPEAPDRSRKRRRNRR